MTKTCCGGTVGNEACRRDKDKVVGIGRGGSGRDLGSDWPATRSGRRAVRLRARSTPWRDIKPGQDGPGTTPARLFDHDSPLADVSHRVRWTTSLHSTTPPTSTPPPQTPTPPPRPSRGSPQSPRRTPSSPPPTPTPTPPPPRTPPTPTPPTPTPPPYAMTRTCTPSPSHPASAPPASPAARHVRSPPSTLG